MFYTRIRSFSRQRLFPSIIAIMLIVSGLILPGAFGVRPAAANSLLVVTSLLDTAGLCGSSCTLRQALVQSGSATGPTIIVFNVSGTITLTGKLVISSPYPVTIDGIGQTIIVTGSGTQLFYIVTGNTVTMTNLTLMNGSAGGYAGAIQNEGTLTLNSTTVSNNTAQTAGGIGNNGTLTINNSYLGANTGSLNGGAIDNSYLLTINDSSIVSNTSPDGGGIYNEYGGTVILNRVNIASNTSTKVSSGGGGLYNTGTLIANNVSITGNSTVASGSAIYNDGVLTLNASTLSNNHASQSGGGIYALSSTSNVIVNDLTIGLNTANNGGGIYNDTQSTFSVNNSTIAGNTAKAGGGIFNNTFTVFHVTSSVIATNTLTGSSGPDVNGSITSYGNNLVGNSAASTGWTTTGNFPDLVGTAAAPIDPKLNTLGNYGGNNQTYELLPGSPAIGAGFCLNSASNPANGIDERGVGRKNLNYGHGCDIGSFESYSFTPTTLPSIPVNSYTDLSLTASGGKAPYTYTLSTGLLPTGLTLSSAGTLYGTPAKGGVYTFNVFVNDSVGDQDLGTYSLNVIGPKDTIGVFRPSTGTFFLRRSNTTGYADYTLPFGNANSLPVAGDWNGDGIDTVGYADSTTGSFALTNGALPNSSVDYTLTFGNPGDRSFSGHWSINSAADGVGVYRGTNGILYIKSALVTGFADYAMVLGNPGDLPVAGDWNGKGFDSVGIYRSGTSSFYLSNKLINGNITADITVRFGSGVAVPIAGDWTGSGYASLALYNNGVFTTKNYPYSGSTPDNTFAFGAAGDLPVAGMWAQGNGNAANPVHTAPPTILVPKTATPIAPSGSNGSAPGGNRIGG